MKHLLLIALGGATGSICRYGLMNIMSAFSHNKLQLGTFPLGTLFVNIIGSFCIGIFYVLITEKFSLHPDWRNIAMVGFLAAFTTFSTFSLDTITLLENGQLLNALIYVSSSLCICVTATWLAISLTRMV